MYENVIIQGVFMKKKVLMSIKPSNLRLAVCVLFMLIGTSAVFAQTPTMDKLRFTEHQDSRTYNVHAANNSISGAVVIPDTYNGIAVTRVAQGGFQNITGITSVTVPNSVTVIDVNAFRGCTGLTSVNLGAGVITLQGNAFNGCTGLTSVTIPASVNTFGSSTFANCTNLTSVTFQGRIGSMTTTAFTGDLNTKWRAGGAGVYTRSRGSDTWTRTGDAPIAPLPPPIVNTSLNGVWEVNGTQITVSGNTGVFSTFGSLTALYTDAVNKGYVKLGDQRWRNIRSTGNLTWSAEQLGIDFNQSSPNVATGASYKTTTTITMSADGKTLTVDNLTYTRR